jgi:hypothetical protein
MWDALQHAEWVGVLATSRWLYGLVSVAHYSAVFFCVGTVALRDLRILGFVDSPRGVSASAEQLRPSMWAGFAVVVISGFLLFTVNAGNFAAATPFILKIVVSVLAVMSTVAIEWNSTKWNRAPVIPLTAKFAALISMVLWLGALLVSVEVPALTGLG